MRTALALIAAEPGLELARYSDVWETEPVGGLSQRSFLNLAAVIRTKLAPLELLVRLLAIEAVLGRRRVIPNGPRTADIDILTYGNRAMRSPLLVLPHPRMTSRLFVLAPLAQVAPRAAARGVGAIVRRAVQAVT